MKGPVLFDRETEGVLINLPEEGKAYGAELTEYLYECYAFEGLNASILEEMNEQARAWLAAKGVHAQWE